MKYSKLAGLAILVIMLMAGPAAAQNYEVGSMSIGIFGGYAFSVAGDADQDNEGSNFKHQFTGGGGVMYRFPMGFALELDAQYLNFKFEQEGLDEGDDDTEIGKLTQVPLMLWAKWQGKVEQGVTGHGGVGIGVNFTSFSLDDDYLTDLGLEDSGMKVEPKTAFVFGVNAGIDYFFTPEFSVSLDGKYLYSKVDYDTTFDDASGEEDFEGTFNGHNISILLGLRYWFPVE
jgi:opacity protein-like surface antigen